MPGRGALLVALVSGSTTDNKQKKANVTGGVGNDCRSIGKATAFLKQCHPRQVTVTETPKAPSESMVFAPRIDRVDLQGHVRLSGDSSDRRIIGKALAPVKQSRQRKVATTESKVPASGSDRLDLQRRVTQALVEEQGGTDLELNMLACDLAVAGETAALVRVWDLLGGAGGRQAPATWTAVEMLHSKGKGRIQPGTLNLPPLTKAALTPARRLHKICKGRVVARRSDLAGQQLERAVVWVAAQRGEGGLEVPVLDQCGGGRGRALLIKALQKGLGVSKEVARGLVTKLKQKKLVGPNRQRREASGLAVS